MKAYGFASVDYPGAVEQAVIDSNGTTAVGAFQFDPFAVTPTPRTAFTFTGGVYHILSVPGSTSSDASGINEAGLIVGAYQDLSGTQRGYANNGGTFSNVDFPGARSTQAVGVNDAGQIVGSYVDAAGDEHGFVNSGDTFKAIDLPEATTTVAIGINAAGALHGFIYASGAFGIVDVAGASGTFLTRIKKGGMVTGLCIDALGGVHGLTGQ